MAKLQAAYRTILSKGDSITGSRFFWPLLLIGGLLFSIAAAKFDILDQYVQLILIYVGINIILTASLNLINGYMGEFSVGHAGFMAIGAYVASLLTVKVFPAAALNILFPAAILAGGIAAALIGFLVAIPSFKTRGDYLAIVTLAFGRSSNPASRISIISAARADCWAWINLPPCPGYFSGRRLPSG